MFKLDNLLENLTGYIEARIELVKMDIREEIANVITKLVYFVALAFFGVFALIFISISLAQWLNYLLDSIFGGYFIVTGLYIALVVTIALSKNFINAKALKMTSTMFKPKPKPNQDEQPQ